jgi:hypothetical protein
MALKKMCCPSLPFHFHQVKPEVPGLHKPKFQWEEIIGPSFPDNSRVFFTNCPIWLQSWPAPKARIKIKLYFDPVLDSVSCIAMWPWSKSRGSCMLRKSLSGSFSDDWGEGGESLSKNTEDSVGQMSISHTTKYFLKTAWRKQQIRPPCTNW